MLEIILFFVCIAALFGVICFFRAMFRATPPAPKQPARAGEDPARRATAIAQLRQVHAAARDARKQAQQAIDEDPVRAAQVLGKIMKH